MSGSIRNNGAAWGSKGSLAIPADWTLFSYVQQGTYGTGPTYQYLLTAAEAVGHEVYAEVYSGELRYYSSGNPEIPFATGSDTTWFAVVIRRSGGDIDILACPEGGTSFTVVASFAQGNANLTDFGVFALWYGSGITGDGGVRKTLLWDADVSDAELLAEMLAVDPVRTTNLKFAGAVGATPTTFHVDASVGGVGDLALTGTPITDSYDPIPAASGGAIQVAAAVAGSSSVTAALSVRRGLSAAIVGVGTVAATPKVLRRLSAAINGVGTVTAALTRKVPLAAAVVGVATVAAALARRVPLAAQIAGTSTVAATLGVLRRLVAAVTGTGTVAATLRESRVQAVVQGTGSVTAALSVRRGLSATVQGVGSVTSNLLSNTGAQVVAVVQGTSTVSAALSVRRGISAAVVGSGVVASPALKRPVPLAAAVVGSSIVEADLVSTAGSIAAVVGTSTVTADLKVRRGLTAQVMGVGVVAATAGVLRRLAANVAGTSSVTADLTVDEGSPLTASVQGISTVTAFLSVRRRLAAAINGVATFVASLQRVGETIETPYRIEPEPPIYVLTPEPPLYVVSVHMQRFPDFDPNAIEYLEWDLSKYAQRRGSPIASVTVTEVTMADVPVVTPTVIRDLATVADNKVRTRVTDATAAAVGALVRLRCSFTHADGRVGHITGVLPIRHL